MARRSLLTRSLALAGLSLLAVTVGCGGTEPANQPTPSPTAVPTPTATATPTSTASPTPSASPSTPAAVVTDVHVYLVQGEKLVAAHRAPQVKGGAVLRAALTELFQGPNPFERSVGLTSAVPAGTVLNDVALSAGTATVDVSRAYESGGGTLSMGLRLAQVVYTATQFPTVQRVVFRLDGQPVTVFSGEGIVIDHPATRAQFEELVPAILIDSPGIGETVRSGPLTIRGEANVFEAVLFVAVTDWDGRVVAEQRVMATSGTGTGGTFSVTVTTAQPMKGVGEVLAWSLSAKDGSRINVLEYPVHVQP